MDDATMGICTCRVLLHYILYIGDHTLFIVASLVTVDPELGNALEQACRGSFSDGAV